MKTLEDIIEELKEERDSLARHIIDTPALERSLLQSWYKGHVQAYDKMIKAVEKYLLKKD